MTPRKPGNDGRQRAQAAGRASPGAGRSGPDRPGRPVAPKPAAPERDDLTAAGAPASFTDDDRWIDQLEELADGQARAMGIRPQVEFEVPGIRVVADIGEPAPGPAAYGAPEATRPAPGAGGPASPGGDGHGAGRYGGTAGEYGRVPGRRKPRGLAGGAEGNDPDAPGDGAGRRRSP